MEEMMMKGVGVKCRVINWNNVKGERGKGEERRGEERRGEGVVSIL